MAKRDANYVIRLMPIAVGSLGAVLLLFNRLTTPALTTNQARSDVLGVILAAVLVLVGLLWQQVQPRSPDTVVLEGQEGFELQPDLPDELKIELAWASHLLLTNSATRTIIVVHRSRVLLRRGILGPNPQVQAGAIVQRVMATQKPIYLVDLKLYPGRIEFDYLPPNTQGVICQPLGSQGVMILGANAPRSYTKQDEAWITGIADKLTNTLAGWQPEG